MVMTLGMGINISLYSSIQLTLDLLSCILLVVVLAVLFDAKSTKNFGTRKFQSTSFLFKSRKRHLSVKEGAKAHSLGELKFPSSQTLLARNGTS